MKRVYCLGSINVDVSVLTGVFPMKGETVHGDSFHLGIGGKGMNEAIAIHRAGGDLHFLAKIGNDAFGGLARSSLKKLEGADLHVLENGSSTGMASIILHEDDNRIIVIGGANLEIDEEEVSCFLESAQEGDIFVTALENNLSAIAFALKLAREKGMITILNPSPIKPMNKELLSLVDYLVVNEGEGRKIMGLVQKEETIASIDTFVPFGLKGIVMTLGDKGVAYFDQEHSFALPGQKVEVVDTVGAGDTFLGYFASSLASGLAIEENLGLAVKASALAVTKMGASDSIPTKEEVVRYFK